MNTDEINCRLKRIVDGTLVERDFDCYQELALRTADERAKTDPVYTALGLCGEAGEFAEVIKHEEYHGHPEDKIKKLKELGDCLWYLTVAAKKAGFSLSDVATANVRKLAKRYPDGFTSEASQARADGEVMT